MEIDFFVFSVEVFQFSKLHQNEAKHDKVNFKSQLDRDVQGQYLGQLLEKLA